MELNNRIEITVAPDELWEFLHDVEAVAACMPGAVLEGGTAEEPVGSVKVRVGPISASYRGSVRFTDVDEDDRRMVLHASGSDQKGGGRAEAEVVVAVRPEGDHSVLAIDTDLVIQGRVAQFGRGVLKDVSQDLMGRFARAVEERAGGTRAAEPGTGEVDALAVAIKPLVRRALPVLAAAALVGLVVAAVRAARR